MMLRQTVLSTLVSNLVCCCLLHLFFLLKKFRFFVFVDEYSKINAMNPQEILAEAKAAPPKTRIEEYRETVQTLREKGYSWREIADSPYRPGLVRRWRLPGPDQRVWVGQTGTPAGVCIQVLTAVCSFPGFPHLPLPLPDPESQTSR